ncbi:hypothetical protein OF83DRAFT_1143864 [Amylostereum chailletii]|nr:hypothetical protein OF83DRAFT_1143864 [Amylostereum chailletii]
MPGLNVDELSAIVSATFADFDDIARDAPSLQDHRCPRAYTPSLDPLAVPAPSRFPRSTTRLAATIIRKVKSHASSFPFVSVPPLSRPSTPAVPMPSSFLPSPGPSAPPSPPAKRPRSRARSLPRTLFKRHPKDSPPPPPPLPRVPRRPLNPPVPLASYLSASPDAPPRGRDPPRLSPRLSFVYGIPPAIERSPGSSNARIVALPPLSAHSRAPPPVRSFPLLFSRVFTMCISPSNPPSSCPRSRAKCTIALRPARRSPSPPLPVAPGDPPSLPPLPPITFPSPPKNSTVRSPQRTTPSGKMTSYSPLRALGAPSRAPQHPTASSSPARSPLDNFTRPPGSASSLLAPPLPPALSTRSNSLPTPSPLLLPFPLPPDSAGDAITLRVTTPQPRPPPQQPLPRTPPSAGLRPRLGSRQRKDSERTILFRPKHTRTHSRSRPLRADAAAAIAHALRTSPRGLRAKPSRENTRGAVDEMFTGGQVPFTNPWADSFYINLGEETENAEPESDLEPERDFDTTKAKKKVSVASQCTTSSEWTTTTFQSSSCSTTVTAATTMSAQPSPLVAFFDNVEKPGQPSVGLDPSPLPRSPPQISSQLSTGVRLLPDGRPLPHILLLGAIPVCLEASNWAAFRASCMREDVVLQADECSRAQDVDVRVEIVDRADGVEVALRVRSPAVPCAREYLPAIPRMSPIEFDASFGCFGGGLDARGGDADARGGRTFPRKAGEVREGCPVLAFEVRLPTTLRALGRRAGELGLGSGVSFGSVEQDPAVVERSGWFE